MKLAIVGSRGFSDYKFLENEITNTVIERVDLIISGGARGTDTLAERFADSYEIAKKILPAIWTVNGKFIRSAGFTRNIEIVNECDKLIAFWDGHSPGTAHSITVARRQKKLMRVVLV